MLTHILSLQEVRLKLVQRCSTIDLHQQIFQVEHHQTEGKEPFQILNYQERRRKIRQAKSLARKRRKKRKDLKAKNPSLVRNLKKAQADQLRAIAAKDQPLATEWKKETQRTLSSKVNSKAKLLKWLNNNMVQSIYKSYLLEHHLTLQALLLKSAQATYMNLWQINMEITFVKNCYKAHRQPSDIRYCNLCVPKSCLSLVIEKELTPCNALSR